MVLACCPLRYSLFFRDGTHSFFWISVFLSRIFLFISLKKWANISMLHHIILLTVWIVIHSNQVAKLASVVNEAFIGWLFLRTAFEIRNVVGKLDLGWSWWLIGILNARQINLLALWTHYRSQLGLVLRHTTMGSIQIIHLYFFCKNRIWTAKILIFDLIFIIFVGSLR